MSDRDDLADLISDQFVLGVRAVELADAIQQGGWVRLPTEGDWWDWLIEKGWVRSADNDICGYNLAQHDEFQFSGVPYMACGIQLSDHTITGHEWVHDFVPIAEFVRGDL